MLEARGNNSLEPQVFLFDAVHKKTSYNEQSIVGKSEVKIPEISTCFVNEMEILFSWTLV